jgi:hypothetical protein
MAVVDGMRMVMAEDKVVVVVTGDEEGEGAVTNGPGGGFENVGRGGEA